MQKKKKKKDIIDYKFRTLLVIFKWRYGVNCGSERVTDFCWKL